MARQDLLLLAKKASKQLQKDLRNKLNVKPHVFSTNVASVYQEVIAQLGSEVSSEQRKEIYKAVQSYSVALFKAFKARAKTTKTLNIKQIGKDNAYDHTFVVANKRGENANAFDAIAKIRINPIKNLRNSVFNIMQRPDDESIKARILGSPAKNDRRIGGLLDIGHKKGVAIQQAEKALARFSIADIERHLGIRSELILSSFERRKDKVFRIEVQDESSVRNRSQATKEKKYKQAVEKSLKDFIARQGDWANQKGSRSKNDIIMAELLRTAKLSGAKRVGKAALKTGTASVKVPIKHKASAPKIVDSRVNIGSFVKENKNWNSLLGIINAKLAEQIMSNMKFPRLVNRTGRFANSAIVTGVQITQGGFPSFIFDYQRDPYDVFDKSKGAQPWATPERDPSNLISLSIREIVREFAVGRFYTRRRA